MIKFQNQVPSIYPSASRDFQYLCWLIDIVLNSVKHNVDDLYDLPNSKADPKLTELLAMTLGFKVKRNYDQNQLHALVAALPRILKYKGTKTAVEMAGNALIAASGASGDFNCDLDEKDPSELKIRLPVDLVDVSLFTDLLSYILPAGMTYHIVRQNRDDKSIVTRFKLDERKRAKLIPELDYAENGKTFPGLANMFDVTAPEQCFSNYNNSGALNVSLLDNTIIPAVVEPMVYTVEAEEEE
jgi:hypothetical protein